MYTYMYMHVWIYLYAYVHGCVCACLCMLLSECLEPRAKSSAICHCASSYSGIMDINTWTHIYTFSNTHAHTHTHTLSLSKSQPLSHEHACVYTHAHEHTHCILILTYTYTITHSGKNKCTIGWPKVNQLLINELINRFIKSRRFWAVISWKSITYHMNKAVFPSGLSPKNWPAAHLVLSVLPSAHVFPYKIRSAAHVYQKKSSS